MAKKVERYFSSEVMNAIKTAISRGKDMIVFDLETTGFSPEKNDIIEIAAIKVNSKLEVIEEFNHYVNPGCPIPNKITELTGITDKMVFGVPTIEELLPEIEEFFNVDTVLAYNSSFDCRFMSAAYKKCGKLWMMEEIDVLKMARELLPREKTGDMKLCNVSHYLGADAGVTFHNALDDAKVTLEVLRKFCDMYDKKKVEEKKEKPFVKWVSYWAGYNHKQARLTVETQYGKVYLNLFDKSWREKDKGVFEKLSVTDIQKAAMDKVGVATIEEFCKYKKNSWE